MTKTNDAGRTVILSAADVRRYLTTDRCLAAVAEAFRLLGTGAAEPPSSMGIHVAGGTFHIKAGVLDLARKYFVAKTNANFPGNPREYGLPTIQGVIVLCDAIQGRVLALIDSLEITAKRTAAATALAARYLARRDAEVLAICGCGFQAPYQIDAVRAVLPIKKVIAIDADAERAGAFARSVSHDGSMEGVAGTLSDAARAQPDVWITCTTSSDFILFPEHVKAGAFVAGVGVDNENKRELAPALLQRAHVVGDHLEQCAHMGDLHHAIDADVTPRSVRELGAIVAGQQGGRDDERDIYVFDSTGIAHQDVAACAAVFEAVIDAEADGQKFMTVNLSA